MADEDETDETRYGSGDAHNSVGGQARVEHVLQAGYVGTVNYHSTSASDSAVRVPLQLPGPTANFVGRESEQLWIVRSATAWEDAERPFVATLRGLVGVGKTTLGRRISRELHRVLPEEEDEVGVLYVDLERHRHDGVVDVSAALAELLYGFGLRGEKLLLTEKERADEYETLTRAHRVVVVIDNVRTGAEATPLLPSSERGVALLVSHAPLYDVGYAAVDVSLKPLEDEEALHLLMAGSRDQRLVEDQETAQELVRLCGGLPLLLALVVEQLKSHPLRRTVRLLKEFGRTLKEDGIDETEAVLDVAYAELGDLSRRLYGLLAAAPATDVARAAVVALLGADRDTADDAMEGLLNAGLVQVDNGHLHMHSLVRAHAARRARAEGLDTERRGPTTDAVLRLVRWYLRQAQHADLTAAGERMTFAPRAELFPDAPDALFASKAHALAWLAAERRTLNECVRIAHRHEAYREAWALCEPLWTLHLDHPYHADAIEAFELGLDAALRDEHPAAVVRMRCQLARPLWEVGRFEEAQSHLDLARLAAESRSGAPGLTFNERKLLPSALEFRGRLEAERGQWGAAVPYYEESLSSHEAIGNDYGALLLMYQLGQAKAHLGEAELAAAEDLLRRAHTAARADDRARMIGRTASALAQLLRRLGRFQEAKELLLAALDRARELRSNHEETRVLKALADLAAETGSE
ncbi:NB-ARC domain protein [Actinobacteria bacterium OK074]|nr:NB-ARC domain protein [Actinobacteria bacterium OK074]